LLRQIQYFQSVVRNNSFSEAAEECHISQSAISQQIQALERELGFQLLERKNRKFTLTEAGEHFYQKSLILVADYERIVTESARIASGNEVTLRIGFLRGYSGTEFHEALAQFSVSYPDVDVKIEYGNHEELYQLLRTEQVDIVLNDQRRAFSDEYVNLILTSGNCCVEVPARSPLAELQSITPQELKNMPCILVTSPAQQEIEREYYHDIVGFQGGFLFSKNLEEARMMVISRKGVLPVEGPGNTQNIGVGMSIHRIPLYRNGEQITRNYCAFWKKDNSGYYIEEFAELLKAQYAE
jgi:DNA-binding transcriptional LysR family regulator